MKCQNTTREKKAYVFDYTGQPEYENNFYVATPGLGHHDGVDSEFFGTAEEAELYCKSRGYTPVFS